MKKISIILLVIFLSTSFCFAAVTTDSTYAVVQFAAQGGADIGFSANELPSSHIMPAMFSPGSDVIEFELNGTQWSTQPFYLNSRVYTAGRIKFAITANPLQEYTIDYSNSSNNGFVINGSTLSWSNKDSWTMDDGQTYELKKVDSEKKVEISEPSNLTEQQLRKPRYYSFKFELELDSPDQVEDKFYRTVISVDVVTI